MDIKAELMARVGGGDVNTVILQFLDAGIVLVETDDAFVTLEIDDDVKVALFVAGENKLDWSTNVNNSYRGKISGKGAAFAFRLDKNFGER